MSYPLVAIIGRPNVGKSTLFNKLAGKQIAIISDIPGTTRDRVTALIKNDTENPYEDTEKFTQEFTDEFAEEFSENPEEFSEQKSDNIPYILADTGGMTFGKDGEFFDEDIRRQAQCAFEDADMLIVCMNSREEITSDDREIIDYIRKNKHRKPIIFLITKCDGGLGPDQKARYYEFGLGDPHTISSFHNSGIRRLRDIINQHLLDLEYRPEHFLKEKNNPEVANIAFVGKPNVGKSSLINAYLSDERLIVSDVSGTTRDSVSTEVKWEGKKFMFIDTAGIRRSGKIQKGIEKYSVLRSTRAIEECDIACVLFDAHEGIGAQDQAVVHQILEAKKGLILVVNKWDTQEKGEEAKGRFMAYIRRKFAFIPWAAVSFVSAKTKRGIVKIFEIAEKIQEERAQKISTGKLNVFLKKINREHPPTGTKRVKPKVFYFTQVGTNPPSFKLFVNKREYFHFSYFRYLENRLRETFGFYGTGVEIEVVDRKSIYQK